MLTERLVRYAVLTRPDCLKKRSMFARKVSPSKIDDLASFLELLADGFLRSRIRKCIVAWRPRQIARGFSSRSEMKFPERLNKRVDAFLATAIVNRHAMRHQTSQNHYGN